jgi:hypothetical protein
MTGPDIGDTLRQYVGGIVLELATAQAVIKAQAATIADLESAAEAATRRGREDGAQGADGPRTGEIEHG